MGGVMEISRWCKPPDLRPEQLQPRRGWAKASQIPLIEYHSTALKERQIFLPEGACPMMLLLVLDAGADVLQLRGACGKTSISFLPRKRDADLCMHPSGGDRFCFAKDIGQRVRCLQSDQQMHVVRDAVNGVGHAVECANHSAKVSMQPVPPDRGNQGFVVPLVPKLCLGTPLSWKLRFLAAKFETEFR